MTNRGKLLILLLNLLNTMMISQALAVYHKKMERRDSDYSEESTIKDATPRSLFSPRGLDTPLGFSPRADSPFSPLPAMALSTAVAFTQRAQATATGLLSAPPPRVCLPEKDSLEVKEDFANPFAVAYQKIQEVIAAGTCTPDKILLLFNGEPTLFQSAREDHLSLPDRMQNGKRGITLATPNSLKFLRQIQDLRVNTLMISHESPVLQREDHHYYPKDLITNWRKSLSSSLPLASQDVKLAAHASEDEEKASISALYSKILALSLIYKKQISLFGNDYLFNFLSVHEITLYRYLETHFHYFDSIFIMEYAGVFEDLATLPDGSQKDLKTKEWGKPMVAWEKTPFTVPGRIFDHQGRPADYGFFLLEDMGPPGTLLHLNEWEKKGLMYFDQGVLMTSGHNEHLAVGKLLSNLGQSNLYECVFNISQQKNSLLTMQEARKKYPHLKVAVHLQVP